jgi:hypothetical protein
MTNADLVKRLRAEATPFAPHNDPVVMVLRSTLREAADALERCEQWVSIHERLPADETPVLIICNGCVKIGELRWEHPTFEETYEPFRYWDDPHDDGQIWEWTDVTHWMPLPEPPVGADHD